MQQANLIPPFPRVPVRLTTGIIYKVIIVGKLTRNDGCLKTTFSFTRIETDVFWNKLIER
jgi:hypothetical protein